MVKSLFGHFCVLVLLMQGVSGLVRDKEAIAFQSSSQQTALLELYTSEGCSSCPPAEKWLGRLTGSPKLWRDFVPVAFHVDYWDYLGWRDAWGKVEFSKRQREYASAWRSDSIYTPEFVLNGREWRSWAGQDSPTTSTNHVGVITVTSTDTNHWLIRFSPTTNVKRIYEAHLAWLISGVNSNVQAGENRGRKLEHDFIVLNLTHSPMRGAGEKVQCELSSPMPVGQTNRRVAVAVWVTEPGRLGSIQATGGGVTLP